MKNIEYDLIIIGSSLSATCSAIEASRCNLKVALVDENISFGGMITDAGVSAFDGNNQIAGVIFREFRQRLREYYKTDELDTGWVSNTLFEPEVGQKILESMIDNRFVDLYLSSKAIKIYKKSISPLVIERVEFQFEDEIISIKSKYFILSDEFGDVLEKLNIKNHYGLEQDMDAPYTLSHPQDFTYTAILQFDNTLKVVDDRPSWAFEGEFKGILKGQQFTLTEMLEYGLIPNNKIMLNWPIQGNDYYGNYFEQDRKILFQKAKEKTMRLVKNIQSSIDPSCNLKLSETSYPKSKDYLPYIPYIRESRRIYGKETLTLTDLISDKIFKNAIAVGDYPLDHHRDLDKSYKKIDFPQIHPFSIPFGCLIPLNTKNILVVEKSISVSSIVNGTTRLQPVVMQLGQVAALAIYLAKKQNIDIEELDIEQLQDLILDKNGYLFPTHDISPDDITFKDVQRSIKKGNIKLDYYSEGWVNKARCLINYK